MSSRLVKPLVAFIVLVLAGIVFVRWSQPDAPVEPKAQRRPTPRAETPRARAPLRYELDDPDIEIPPGSTVEPPHFDLSNLDFEALRAQSPDNLYWQMAVPTDDPDVLRARAEEKKRRNDQYGRVLSNTATTEEIEAYYAYRRRLSEDYIEVSQLILDEHGAELSSRDVGLLELGISMHASRLSENPKNLQEALDRKAQYDEVKQAWQARQAEREELDASPSSPD